MVADSTKFSKTGSLRCNLLMSDGVECQNRCRKKLAMLFDSGPLGFVPVYHHTTSVDTIDAT